jgi:hypothetical protein
MGQPVPGCPAGQGALVQSSASDPAPPSLALGGGRKFSLGVGGRLEVHVAGPGLGLGSPGGLQGARVGLGITAGFLESRGDWRGWWPPLDRKE